MPDFDSLSSRTPLPAVDVSDMKHVWELTSEVARSHVAQSGAVGIDIGLVASRCSQGADPGAVFFRVVLLRVLLDGGFIDNWRDGDHPHEVVFQTLASFPLPDGIQGFDPEELARVLGKAE